MRICFIVGAFPKMKCGVGDYTYNLALELAKTNEIYVITSSRASNKLGNMKIYNIIDEWDKSGSKKILEKLQEIKPDLVNIQYPSDEYKNNLAMNLLPNKIKKQIKCTVVATIHEYECFTLKRKIRNYLNFKNLDKIIVVEKEFIDQIKKDFKKVDIDFIKISSNIPRSEISDKQRLELLKKYGLENTNSIGYFGFANPSKGLESLFWTVSKLENTKLLFINKLDENNEYHKKLLNLIEELNIKDRIVITGFLDSEKDVSDLLSITSVNVFPFIDGVKLRNGSFLAAYNQKVPIITTGENFKEDNGIYCVEPKNEEELLKKIKEVLKEKKVFDREILNFENVAKNYMESFEEGKRK